MKQTIVAAIKLTWSILKYILLGACAVVIMGTLVWALVTFTPKKVEPTPDELRPWCRAQCEAAGEEAVQQCIEEQWSNGLAMHVCTVPQLRHEIWCK